MSENEPLSEPESIRKDTTYSPGSDAETRAKQGDADTSPDADIDDDQIVTRPGTGGPDDVGEIEVAEEDLNLPWTKDSKRD